MAVRIESNLIWRQLRIIRPLRLFMKRSYPQTRAEITVAGWARGVWVLASSIRDPITKVPCWQRMIYRAAL